jgi:8-oxo-dGTP diphosphatase
MPVVAAGALLWRKEKDGLKVLLIHRGRYDDWSWPKGKLDKGEGIAEAAVREIKEETGIKVALGPKLFECKYELDNGSNKIVHYWSAQVSDAALRKQKFEPDEEVSSFKWVTPSEAQKLLSYEHDNDPLTVLIDFYNSNLLETKPIIILRHAKATPRDQWKKGEVTRPLLPTGLVQAAALTTTLNAYAPTLVLTSNWKRCKDTVLPYLHKYKIKHAERSQLSELGAKNGPKRTTKLIDKIVEDCKGVVICTHRPALPTIVNAIGSYGTKDQRKELEEVLSMKPAQFFVLHMSKTSGKKPSKIVSIESVAPTFDD